MKILILANLSNGLYLFRKELLVSFLKEGHEVVVSVPPDENVDKLYTVASSTEEQSRFRVLETPFERRGNNPVKDAGLFLRYMKLLKEEKPDVVLTYTIKPNLYGGLACRLKRVPYLVNVTGLGTAIENGGMLSRALILFYRIATGKARRVFFQNSNNRDFMLKYNVASNNSALLPGSGVNLSENSYEEYPDKEQGVKVLAVIRIMRDKGIEEYLSMIGEVAEEFPEVRFGLVGDYEAESKETYEPMVDKLVEEGKLHYYGHSDKVHEIMAQSHMIVHPSYHEGLSNVLLEAAACGRPVLASRIHGCMETFDEGISGFSFEPKDSVSLTETMKKMLTLEWEDWAGMGRAGRKWVEDHFDRNLILAKYEEELLNIENKQ